MPGLTSNTTLLAAANQIIVALNELVAKPSGGGGEGTDVSQIVAALTFNDKGLAEYAAMLETNGDTLNENITLISDALEAQTTMQETRSIAEVTALNTNFDNLITSTDTISTRLTVTNSALVDINSTVEDCCVNLQVRLGQIITAIGDIRLLPPSGVPGDTGGPFLDEPPIPPENISDIVLVDAEACKRANWAYDYTAKFLDDCSILSEYKGSAMTAIFTIVSGLFAEIAIPAGVFAFIVTTIVQMATSFQGTTFAEFFDDLRDEFEADKDEIICEFYNYIRTKNYDGVKNLFYLRTVDAVIAMADTSGLSLVLKDLLKYSLPAIVQALNSNLFANKVFDENDVDIEAYSPENPASCDTCAPQEFLGWWIPKHSLAVQVEYVQANAIHNGTIDPGQEIYFGQYIDDYPSPVHLLDSNGTDPNTIDSGNGVNTCFEIISPDFVAEADAQIIFTVAGGGDGSPNADMQWHFYTYDNGVWSASLGNYGNGEYTMEIAETVTQAIINYYAPFTHSNPLPRLTDIQFVNITV